MHELICGVLVSKGFVSRPRNGQLASLPTEGRGEQLCDMGQ